MENDNIIIVSGGYDPLHSGHIEYIKAAKELGGFLIVGVNSDKWLIRKKGYFVLPFTERRKIVESLKWPDLVVPFNDDDGSACTLIADCKRMYPFRKYVFCNGGDRTYTNTPEMEKYNANSTPSVQFTFGVGGNNKLNASSSLIDDFIKRYQTTQFINVNLPTERLYPPCDTN